MVLDKPKVIALLPGDTFNLVNNTDHDGKPGEIIYITLIQKGYRKRTACRLIRQALNFIIRKRD